MRPFRASNRSFCASTTSLVTVSLPLHWMLLEMDGSQFRSPFSHRRSCRVRGPRPCSWVSSSSDSCLNEHRDIWSWSIARSNVSRESTLTSTDSSFSSPSPVQTSDILVEYSETPYNHHPRRRKPGGPRAPRNSTSFDVQPGLLINTTLPATPRRRRESSATTPVQRIVIPQSPCTINTPTDFLLDWDVIFEVLGCSEALPDDTKG